MQNNFRRVYYTFLGVLFLLVILAVAGARLYTDWLWFQSLEYQRVFLTIILSDIGLRLGVGVAFFILLFTSLMFTRGYLLRAAQQSTVLIEDDLLTIQGSPWSRFLTNRFLIAAFAALSLIMAFLFSFSVAGDWVTLQNFYIPHPLGSVSRSLIWTLAFMFSGCLSSCFFTMLPALRFWLLPSGRQ